MPASNDNYQAGEPTALLRTIFGAGLCLGIAAAGFALWASWQ